MAHLYAVDLMEKVIQGYEMTPQKFLKFSLTEADVEDRVAVANSPQDVLDVLNLAIPDGAKTLETWLADPENQEMVEDLGIPEIIAIMKDGDL